MLAFQSSEFHRFFSLALVHSIRLQQLLNCDFVHTHKYVQMYAENPYNALHVFYGSTVYFERASTSWMQIFTRTTNTVANPKRLFFSYAIPKSDRYEKIQLQLTKYVAI